jgi:hypothetical protein
MNAPLKKLSELAPELFELAKTIGLIHLLFLYK